MASDDEILEHYFLSMRYLEASELNLNAGLKEPALFNGLHALELAVKAALYTKIDGPVLTHNVGGFLGKLFKNEYGDDVCRKANRILIQYNVPRYPGLEELNLDETRDAIEFIHYLVSSKVHDTLAAKGLFKGE